MDEDNWMELLELYMDMVEKQDEINLYFYNASNSII